MSNEDLLDAMFNEGILGAIPVSNEDVGGAELFDENLLGTRPVFNEDL